MPAIATPAAPSLGISPLDRPLDDRLDLTTKRLFEPGGVTLEERITGAWDELVGEGRTKCPVCRDTMTAARGCDGCGSELS